MTTATVKYISNGYIVSQQGGLNALESVYALTIPEVVYWIGKLFDPINSTAALVLGDAPAPQIIVPADDPVLGQLANVGEIASGGFLVTQFPSPGAGGRTVEMYCATMDAVADALTQIFTPPVTP